MSMQKYDPKALEPKWQEQWAKDKLYEARDDNPKPKWYELEFFPYPSGTTMHVGHVRNYVISDSFARYQRMNGHNVLHPMGWDAFGLPAENHAIQTGTPPQASTDANIAVFKRQLQQMGLSYDWSREINSSSPDYYRWTQWLFLLFYKRKLAYKAKAAVNWCPHDKTVLANEQVIKKDGVSVCERCGHEVEKRELSQWFFKITDYADRLLGDLSTIDWPESVKTMQRNWIGRSVGAEVEFVVEGSKDKITVFTTRPDTIFGATYMVLAPEHPLVEAITTQGQRPAIADYVAKAAHKTDIERMSKERDKTGVFTGAYARNPATKKPIPIWIADYVIGGYGTGAIMAVPAHDQRDLEFARAFDVPIVTVIEPVTGEPQPEPEFRRSIVALVERDNGDILSINWGPKLGGNLLIGGGLEKNEDPVKAAQREIAEETGYTDVELVGQSETIHHHYFAASKSKQREIAATGLHFKLKSEAQQTTALEADEAGKFSVEWLKPNEADARIGDPLHHYVFDKFVRQQAYGGEGVMINSDSYDGMSSAEAREAMVKAFGKEKTQYRMRDWLISRQRYWGAPIPILYCKDCGVVPVPEDQLPVELPPLESYHPSDDGRSPLARVGDWLHTDCPECGGPAERETDTMDTFVDSSWYFLRFADPHNAKAPFDPAKVNHWLPVDTYVGGVEHAVAHLLFARFWTKVLHDAGRIEVIEPFRVLRNQGMIGGHDGRKMGKRYGNAVTPDEVIEQGYGADSLRLYEMFIGPYDQGVDWNPTGIDGTKRFLNRVWALAQEHLAAKAKAGDQKLEEQLARTIHKTIRKVSLDVQEFGFNTAIAAMMEAVNELYRLKTQLPLGSDAWTANLKLLVQLLAPFAPHITEELWQQLGGEGSVHTSDWPGFDPELVADATVTIVIQVNGKLRGQIEAAVDATEASVVRAAQEDGRVKGHLEGKQITKTIFVARKLVNFVVR